jgi:hypothetical protein
MMIETNTELMLATWAILFVGALICLALVAVLAKVTAP